MIVALFDMDGTLFDHDKQLRADLQSLEAPQEYNDYSNLSALFSQPHLSARIRLIRSQPGWWRTLPKIKLGFRLYRMAKNIGYHCKILTKGPRLIPAAWSEKVLCIQETLGPDIAIDIVGETKGGTYGRVLVDDYPTYIEHWLQYRPRGLVIMPAHSYNDGFEHPNVIRCDGTNLEWVRIALQAAYDRADGQHWLQSHWTQS